MFRTTSWGTVKRRSRTKHSLNQLQPEASRPTGPTACVMRPGFQAKPPQNLNSASAPTAGKWAGGPQRMHPWACAGRDLAAVKAPLGLVVLKGDGLCRPTAQHLRQRERLPQDTRIHQPYSYLPIRANIEHLQCKWPRGSKCRWPPQLGGPASSTAGTLPRPRASGMRPTAL